MPDDLTFLMGKFPAALPGGLRYARNHMWCRTEGDCHRFGFTAYAVRLMQDVYFLDWSLSDGDAVFQREARLSGARRKIAPSWLGMTYCRRQSSEEIRFFIAVRVVMQIKRHNFPVTGRTGACGHFVATRALPMFDFKSPGHRCTLDLYIGRNG